MRVLKSSTAANGRNPSALRLGVGCVARQRVSRLGALLGGVVALWMPMGCAGLSTSREPFNLYDAKQAVIAYADSGDYDRDLRAAAAKAQAWIAQRVARKTPGERLAVVFDVDETVISNLPHMREMDFGYVAIPWSDWVKDAAGPALAPVREVYDECRRLGVAVVFITGRKDLRDRAGTERNLRAQGMGEYARLILAQPSEDGLGTAERKARSRASLEQNDGYRVIASIGDQLTDLQGGHAERVFKLPNPFYTIP